MSAQLKTKNFNFKDHIQNIPDFPKPGILFRDFSPLLRNYFGETVAAMNALFTEAEWKKIDYIAAIEARGFVLAAGMAAIKNKGFIKIRKKGKLPGETVSVSYGLEYGTDALEMHHGKGNVLIVDDVLATGGTLKAAAELTVKTGHTLAGFAVLINLAALNNFEFDGMKARHLVEYQ